MSNRLVMMGETLVNVAGVEQLYAVLRARGSVTIRLGELGADDGLTDFRTGTVWLDHRLDLHGFHGTLTHELVHLEQGPVAEEWADAEEVAVRHRTAALLLPALHAVARHRETVAGWSEEQTRAVAAAARVDPGVVRDAVSPPTMPMPAVSALSVAV